jgi:hypothetical protein
VLELSAKGHGRNDIARLLKGQLSEGSVGNIIRENKLKKQQVSSDIEHQQQSQPQLVTTSNLKEQQSENTTINRPTSLIPITGSPLSDTDFFIDSISIANDGLV